MEINEARSNPFHDPNVPSLAEALRRLNAMGDVPSSRKTRVGSAIKTIMRLTGIASEQFPAHGMFLVRQLQRLKHRPTGLSRQSLANCKTELRYLIRTVCGRGKRSEFVPLTPAWRGLRQMLNGSPSLWKLSRFMAFCSAKGTKPDQVDDGTIETFRTAVLESREVHEPEQHVRAAIRAWNKLVDTLPAWPRKMLALAPRRVCRWTIEPERFPKTLQEDVTNWLKHLQRIDPEADDGLRRALRPATIRLHRHQIYKAASALVFAGRPIETITSLACLVELDRFKTLLRYLRERQGGGVSEALFNLATALKATARHYVRVSEEDLKRLSRICANYDCREIALGTKTHDRLMNFEDDRVLGTLLHMPERLLEEAGARDTPSRTASLLAQIAVALEIEWFAPLRLRNLVCLNRQTNIRAVEVNGETRWIITFDRNETKNRSRLIYEIPVSSVQRIERALSLYETRDGWLFPGAKGSHKVPEAFGMQLKREIQRRLGIPFSIHLLRGLNAVLQVKNSENGFEIARAMLGDRDDRVIRDHYTAAADRHLMAKAQETIQKQRIRTAPLAPEHKPYRKAKRDRADAKTR